MTDCGEEDSVVTFTSADEVGIVGGFGSGKRVLVVIKVIRIHLGVN